MMVESRDAELFEDKFSKDIVEHSNPIIKDQSIPQKETFESSKRHYDALIEPRRSQGSIKKRVWETSSSSYKH